MSKKYMFEYVRKYFKERGCELLEIEYKDNSTPMNYKCSCGNMSKIRFHDFKNGQRCMQCRVGKNLFEHVYNYFKEQLLKKEDNLIIHAVKTGFVLLGGYYFYKEVLK